MQLDLNGEKTLDNPTERIVAMALKSLRPDAFAILAQGDDAYIQTYHNEDGTFILEYRDGSYDKHFRAVDETLPLPEIIRAFSAYLSRQANWQAPWAWEKVDFSEDYEGTLTGENAYTLNGREYPKIPVGDEQSPLSLRSGACPECSASVGEFHEPGCECEECPCCHQPLVGCDCR